MPDQQKTSLQLRTVGGIIFRSCHLNQKASFRRKRRSAFPTQVNIHQPQGALGSNLCYIASVQSEEANGRFVAKVLFVALAKRLWLKLVSSSEEGKKQHYSSEHNERNDPLST